MVTGAVVPDQLRTGVSRPCRYEPEVQRSYEEFARHYGTVILPARPGAARDKAKVEAGGLVAQRWILARLRHHTFFALAAMNQRIGELQVELNDRTMRHYRASRRALFEQLDRPALKPLPATRYEHALWKFARAGIDYHVELDGHYYSVPFTLRQERFDLRYTATLVEVFLKGQRVIAHVRSDQRGRHTTLPEHMPKSHQAHLEWSPTRITRWAATIGTATAALVAAILADRRTPSRATAPVSASCGSRSATALSVSKPPVSGRSRSGPVPIATSNRYCSTVSTGCPPPIKTRTTVPLTSSGGHACPMRRHFGEVGRTYRSRFGSTRARREQ